MKGQVCLRRVGRKGGVAAQCVECGPERGQILSAAPRGRTSAPDPVALLASARRERLCDVAELLSNAVVARSGIRLAQISRDPEALVTQALDNHHYPDGMRLFLGTPFAPIEDRDAPGQGFTK